MHGLEIAKSIQDDVEENGRRRHAGDSQPVAKKKNDMSPEYANKVGLVFNGNRPFSKCVPPSSAATIFSIGRRRSARSNTLSSRIQPDDVDQPGRDVVPSRASGIGHLAQGLELSKIS